MTGGKEICGVRGACPPKGIHDGRGRAAGSKTTGEGGCLNLANVGDFYTAMKGSAVIAAPPLLQLPKKFVNISISCRLEPLSRIDQVSFMVHFTVRRRPPGSFPVRG